MNESFAIKLRKNGRTFPVEQLTDEGLRFRGETDARPRKWGLGLWARSDITKYRMDRIRVLRGWASGGFRVKVTLQDGGLQVAGDDPLSLPGGSYFGRLQIADLDIVGGRLRLDLDDDEQVDLKVEIREDPRRIELTKAFVEFDDEIRRPLSAPESDLDDLAIVDWLSAESPRSNRKACLLNLMAKLRTTPEKKAPLIDAVDFVFWTEVDRIYARVQPAFYKALTDLVADPKKPFYAEGHPKAAIHDLLKIRVIEKHLEPDMGGYQLYSFRQEGKTCLQAVVAIPPNDTGNYYADLDIDLANPLQDVVGFLSHMGELLSGKETDHLDLHEKLAKGLTAPYIYYDVV